MFDLALFDLDGTLVDTAAEITLALNVAPCPSIATAVRRLSA